MNHRFIAFAALATVISAADLLPAAAQSNRAIPPRGALQARRQARRNFNAELKELAESLGKRNNVRVVVDPALFVPAKPHAPAATADLGAALDSLVSPMKYAAWRRVYLTQSQTGANLSADKLASAVRALEMVEQSGLVVENTGAKKATTYLKNFSVPADFKDALANQQFDTRGVYVIYNASTSADSRSPEDRMFDLQKEQMELMSQMDPDTLSQSMARGMDLFNSLDPGIRGQMMGTMMQAGMKMWSNMPPDQRNQMMQQLMQNAGQIFGPGGPGGRPN